MLGMKITILALVPSLGTVVHGLHVWVGCARAGRCWWAGSAHLTVVVAM